MTIMWWWKVILLVIFTVVVSATQYVGSPIHCWSPAYFTDAHVEFADSICWVTNTYYLPDPDVQPGQPGAMKRHLAYYQWVPLILLAQVRIRSFSERSLSRCTKSNNELSLQLQFKFIFIPHVDFSDKKSQLTQKGTRDSDACLKAAHNDVSFTLDGGWRLARYLVHKFQYWLKNRKFFLPLLI